MKYEAIKKVCSRLSMQCRFGGDVRRFYSVAEHTVHLVRHAERKGIRPELQLRLWLHDVPENTTGDLLPVVKTDPVIAEAFAPIEHRAMADACHAMRIDAEVGRAALSCEFVKKYDKAILGAEAKYVANPQPGWMPFDENDPMHVAFGVRLQRAEPYAVKFDYWALAMMHQLERIMQEMNR